MSTYIGSIDCLNCHAAIRPQVAMTMPGDGARYGYHCEACGTRITVTIPGAPRSTHRVEHLEPGAS